MQEKSSHILLSCHTRLSTVCAPLGNGVRSLCCDVSSGGWVQMTAQHSIRGPPADGPPTAAVAADPQGTPRRTAPPNAPSPPFAWPPIPEPPELSPPCQQAHFAPAGCPTQARPAATAEQAPQVQLHSGLPTDCCSGRPGAGQRPWRSGRHHAQTRRCR